MQEIKVWCDYCDCEITAEAQYEIRRLAVNSNQKFLKIELCLACVDALFEEPFLKVMKRMAGRKHNRSNS